jgi:hypothetical protein
MSGPQGVSVGRFGSYPVFILTPSQNAVPGGYSVEALHFQAESAWMFGPGQFTGLPPSYTASDWPLMRPSAANFALTGTIGTTS